MSISFIVTSYNVAPYIRQCLDSLAPCLRPQDQVIVIDDGSTDRSDQLVEARLAEGFGPGVTAQAILLGANTMGGVGIPANIGMDRATGDTVFFVDGDDFLEPAGFLACRAEFEAHRPDILIGNYIEIDVDRTRSAAPADTEFWSQVAGVAGDAAAARRLALSMIAVPWRKFYRRDFLTEHRLRFPEGDFFYEDNPFHWQVCRLARQIRFVDRVLCRHRINRPSQTMAATGTEFLAFFDHYETIVAALAGDEGDLRAAALEWLVHNMSWQLARLGTGSYWAYASRAALVLEREAALWAKIRTGFADRAIGGMVEALARGQIAATVGAWLAEKSRNGILTLDRPTGPSVAEEQVSLNQGQTTVDEMRRQLDRMAEQVQSLYRIEEFRALRALNGLPTPDDT